MGSHYCTAVLLLMGFEKIFRLASTVAQMSWHSPPYNYTNLFEAVLWKQQKQVENVFVSSGTTRLNLILTILISALVIISIVA